TTSDIEGGVTNTPSQWGFIGGIFGTFRTSYNSMVGLEANYVQKGGQDLADLGYIDIPFIIGAVIPTDNDAVNFNFYTGIGLGIKVSCSEDESNTSVITDPCGRAKSTEWTWPLGLAFAVRSASGKYFGLDGRYSIGISDAFDGWAARNRSWQFKVLFGIPAG
ncbi:MAG: hypothetical protein KAJ13_12410, partial [Gemmatimonadetes bacterium]|nr:hypothetical protein [Gemmatimonadota bacterium]